MSFLQSIIMGIVEGLTEFLPVSSTAHLLITAKAFNLPSSEFIKSFEIVIQLGAILAVVSLYYKQLFSFKMIKKLLAAFIPTATIGLLLYKIVKNVFLESFSLIVWSLFVGGILLVIFEYWHRRRQVTLKGDREELNYKDCLIIGTCQSLAMVPGVSRSAATIVAGLSLGLSRKAIVEFSFLLAVPVMAAASTLDIYKNYQSFSGQDVWLLAAGFISAFLVALLVIKVFIRYVQRFDFVPFGIYRIILAIILWFVFF